MKRYIKSAVQTCPTLYEFLNAYGSTYDVITLILNDKLVVINDRYDLTCHELKNYLDNTSLSKFGDYLVTDVEPVSTGGNADTYKIYLKSQY